MPQPFPDDPYAARYCLPWVMAAAISDRALGPAQFTAAALARPEVLDLMQRVRVLADLTTTDEDRYAGRVVVHTGGSTFERTVRHATGHPANPMTAAQRRDKQRQALHYAMKPAEAETMLGVLDELPMGDTLPL